LPAFLLMLALSALYDHVRDLPRSVSLFRGLQVVVVAIVANATVTFGRTSLMAWQDVLLTFIAALLLGRGTSPILAICACAVLSVALFRREAASAAHTPDRPNAHTPLLWPALALSVLAALSLLALFAVDRKLFDLAALMMKVDLFAFGGGFASLPLMLHEVVEVRGWLDPKTFMDGIALGQATPGPIVITATFVGYRVHSLAGATVATVGVFFPSFVLVLVTVPYFDRLQRSPLFQKAVRGALTSFVGLLLVVTLRFAHAAPWSPISIPLAALALLALQLKVDILWVVLAGGLVSILML
ncbi:MAG: chromate efflux transporter, partial [Planctomycetes bacterium]|nr:chromate efflux transporter [Planctomycetota bacterium]